jgi:hypothetical protein
MPPACPLSFFYTFAKAGTHACVYRFFRLTDALSSTYICTYTLYLREDIPHIRRVFKNFEFKKHEPGFFLILFTRVPLCVFILCVEHFGRVSSILLRHTETSSRHKS